MREPLRRERSIGATCCKPALLTSDVRPRRRRERSIASRSARSARSRPGRRSRRRPPWRPWRRYRPRSPGHRRRPAGPPWPARCRWPHRSPARSWRQVRAVNPVKPGAAQPVTPGVGAPLGPPASPGRAGGLELGGVDTSYLPFRAAWDAFLASSRTSALPAVPGGNLHTVDGTSWQRSPTVGA